jgi:hypothetical protein
MTKKLQIIRLEPKKLPKDSLKSAILEISFYKIQNPWHWKIILRIWRKLEIKNSINLKLMNNNLTLNLSLIRVNILLY